MADVDEDNLLASSAAASAAAQEQEADEEAQDFRFLTALSSSVILDANQKLPKRGDKDFEANPTKLQASTLEASRQAMHDALSHTRFHNPKQHLLAEYDPDTNGAWVERPKGALLNAMGVWRKRQRPLSARSSRRAAEAEPGRETVESTGALWLHPEEALYLLERGSLDIRWPRSGAEDAEDGEELGTQDAESPSALGLPMSLQGAYAAFVGTGDLKLEEYTVYAGLKRAGYNVVRPSANQFAFAPGALSVPAKSQDEPPAPSFFAALWQRLAHPQPAHPGHRLSLGPLVTPGLYRSYSDIYKLLAVIPHHDPTTASKMLPSPSAHDDDDDDDDDDNSPTPADHTLLPDGTPRLRLTYHVYKASTPYSKRAPPAPDFHVAVVAARASRLPSLAQLDDVLSRVPFEPPRPGQPLYARLRHGYRSVVVAVVDEGITSYLRLGDAGFGSHEIYGLAAGRGGKRGGRRGGGRGGGRGRGGRGG